MMIGGKIEKMMIDQMQTAYDEAARVTREWVAKKK